MSFESLSRLPLALLCFGLVYVLCLVPYRLFFSPISHIPGPKLAAVTHWYEIYFDVFKPGQYVFEIKKLHQRYGPIVRISPRSVSVSDCDFVDAIYEGGHNSKRDKDFDMVRSLGFNASVGGAWQHDLHKKRRQPLNNFFSQSMVLKFEPELLKKTQQLGEIFKNAQNRRENINLSDIYFAYASDIVNQYVFGHNQNVLSKLSQAHKMRTGVAMTLRTVKVNIHFGWIRGLTTLLPRRFREYLSQGTADMARFRMTVRKDIQNVANERNNDADEKGVIAGAAAVKSLKPSIFRELLASPLLPTSEKTIDRLEDEGTLMIMAGTESPAKSIIIAHFHLLDQPQIMSRLRQELKTISQPSSITTTMTQLLQLPYLNAIATESNRLNFGMTGRNSRVAHETLLYTNPQTNTTYLIPPKTPLSISTLLAHTDESIFPDPWSFRPDRWLGVEGQGRRRYMLSLGRGPRTCIGKNLAHAELIMAIAEMARWDMSLWETSELDVRFLHDWHVAHARLGSEGVRATVC